MLCFKYSACLLTTCSGYSTLCVTVRTRFPPFCQKMLGHDRQRCFRLLTRSSIILIVAHLFLSLKVPRTWIPQTAWEWSMMLLVKCCIVYSFWNLVSLTIPLCAAAALAVLFNWPVFSQVMIYPAFSLLPYCLSNHPDWNLRHHSTSSWNTDYYHHRFWSPFVFVVAFVLVVHGCPFRIAVDFGFTLLFFTISEEFPS